MENYVEDFDIFIEVECCVDKSEKLGGDDKEEEGEGGNETMSSMNIFR